jgi:glutamate dehydrogenase (NAD(P)+)
MTQTINFLEQVNRHFDRAAALTKHPKGLLEQIRECNNVCNFAFPIKRDNGDTRSFAPGGPSIAIINCR